LATDRGGVQFSGCSGCLLNGLRLSECESGIRFANTDNTTISNCRISGTPKGSFDLLVDESNQKINLMGNSFSGFTVFNPSSGEGEPNTASGQ
jgi:parallel beta-helix repeat protein